MDFFTRNRSKDKKLFFLVDNSPFPDHDHTNIHHCYHRNNDYCYQRDDDPRSYHSSSSLPLEHAISTSNDAVKRRELHLFFLKNTYAENDQADKIAEEPSSAQEKSAAQEEYNGVPCSSSLMPHAIPRAEETK